VFVADVVDIVDDDVVVATVIGRAGALDKPDGAAAAGVGGGARATVGGDGCNTRLMTGG
jgi:hypothetical protein